MRTGSSTNGFYGGPLLKKLVPLAHRYGIALIAWDFPTLSDPAGDAARAADAFHYGVDAFSPDIEEAPEGTYLTARRVAYYLSLVRKDAGSRPVIATVPRPTSLSLGTYPYAAEARFVDAFAPMVYWSCTEPGAAVAVAIEALRPLRPVVPIGQDYNMASEGGPARLPSGREVWRFVDMARRDGAIGVSLYDLESGGPVQLAALTDYPWQQVAAYSSYSVPHGDVGPHQVGQRVASHRIHRYSINDRRLYKRWQLAERAQLGPAGIGWCGPWPNHSCGHGPD